MKALAITALALLALLAAPSASAAAASSPSADAAAPCYYIYQETNVGPFTYIRRSSCDPGMLYLCGEIVLAADTSCL